MYSEIYESFPQVLQKENEYLFAKGIYDTIYINKGRNKRRKRFILIYKINSIYDTFKRATL